MVDRSPRADITPQQRAEAVAAIIAGTESARAVARRLGVSHYTVDTWRRSFVESVAIEAGTTAMLPSPEARHFDVDNVELDLGIDDGRDRSNERLARCVYDAVIAQLEAITVRARVTGRPSFAERQGGDALAHLDEVAWTQIARLANSLAYAAGELEPEFTDSVDRRFRDGTLDSPA